MSVWLFTREPESVRLAVQPGPAGYRLTIFGPGSATAAFDFAEMDNLDRFRDKYQQDLIARGFALEAFSERRGGDDAQSPPAIADRRRSS